MVATIRQRWNLIPVTVSLEIKQTKVCLHFSNLDLTFVFVTFASDLMGEDFSALLSNMAQLEIEIKDQIKEEETDSTSKRSLRKRSASEDSLHGTRNRKIQRPKKNSANALQFETEKEVKNFYLNINKKVKLKPVLLETILEKDEEDEEQDDATSIIGKKLKRTLNITDGLNTTKALKDKRKGLIKKHLNGKKKPKRIALAKFMEYFKQKVSEEAAVGVSETSSS